MSSKTVQVEELRVGDRAQRRWNYGGCAYTCTGDVRKVEGGYVHLNDQTFRVNGSGQSPEWILLNRPVKFVKGAIYQDRPGCCFYLYWPNGTGQDWAYPDSGLRVANGDINPQYLTRMDVPNE